MSRRRKNRSGNGGQGVPDLVTWEGATFRLAEKIGMMPLLTFAKLAEQGANTEDMEALAAMYDLIQQCVHEDDWPRFKMHATKIRAGDTEFMEFVKVSMQAMAKRPTTRSSDSSVGPQQTSGKSEVDLPSRVAARQIGRPDLQLATLSAAESKGYHLPSQAS